MTDAEGRTGLILHVQRLSTEDGPGIRSTVFFKQCPLACRWCHNPESISPRPELQWFPTRCIGCRSCEDACARACIRLTGEGLQIDRSRCDECGSCASACPSNALETLGRAVSADALVQELVRDRAYYESSGGGVTLSGGEPMAQPGFTAALLRALKDLGIATAVDTSGFASMDSFTRVLPDIDLLLYDLKTIDPDIHRAFTGQANEIILRNLLEILATAPRACTRAASLDPHAIDSRCHGNGSQPACHRLLSRSIHGRHAGAVGAVRVQ